MPFEDDSGVNPDQSGTHSPLWSPFLIIADQLERLLVLNAAWSLQAIPALVAFAWQELPVVIRVALIGYTLIASGPATVVLYGMVRHAAQGTPLHIDLARDLLREQGINGAKALVPLIGLIGLLILGSGIASVPVSALSQLGLLLLLVTAQYWGALIAAGDYTGPLPLLRDAAWLVWRYPAQTLLLTGAVLVAVVIGTISIGGWVLIVPVLIALLQTQMFRTLSDVTE